MLRFLLGARTRFALVVVMAGAGVAQAAFAFALVRHFLALVALIGLTGRIELLRGAAGSKAASDGDTKNEAVIHGQNGLRSQKQVPLNNIR